MVNGMLIGEMVNRSAPPPKLRQSTIGDESGAGGDIRGDTWGRTWG